MRHRRIALYAGISVVVAIGAVWFIYHEDIRSFWAIDSCLDRGGSWNYEGEACRFVED